jgi:hypothetical protein|uniref:Uncharacterized protein n=1 Tax=Caudovirales sp. ctTqA28 TaxID=2826775 RepID=A0A8S5MDS6_9CAUD|nr:MAG TPA: hypothetical protein [Caudovirales sp. ctTqA28]
MSNRITKDHIDSLLATSTAHYNKLHGTTTVCQIVLQNGFNIANGFSSCVDPANFDAKLGRQYAYEDAIKKAEERLWEFEGYRLAMKLKPINILK